MKNQLVKSLFQVKSLILAIMMSVLFASSAAVIADDANTPKHEATESETASNLPADKEVATAWVDVRSWFEYQIDHIDGDPRVPVSDIVEGVSELYPDKNTPIRLYCAAGVRAGTATNALIAAGYTNVQNAGGIEDVRALRKQKTD